MTDMQVKSAKWTDASRTHISAVIDGQTVEVAASDRESKHRRAIGDWEAAGNVIGEPDNTLPGAGTEQPPAGENKPVDPDAPEVDNELPPEGEAKPK